MPFSNLAQRFIFSALTLCLLLPGPSWAIFEDNGARSAINGILERLKRIEDRLSLLESTSQGQITLAESVADKDREIARLRGEIEVAQNKIRQLENDYETLYTNLDKRIAAIEPKSVELDGQIVSVSSSEYQEYQVALAHFKEGNFEQAKQAFELFQNNFKNSTLIPQVQYFVGSCHFALGDYAQSLQIQQKLVEQYPNSARAPDALLSVASNQIALKAINNAKSTLNLLIKTYPSSAAAQSAQKRLEALQ